MTENPQDNPEQPEIERKVGIFTEVSDSILRKVLDGDSHLILVEAADNFCAGGYQYQLAAAGEKFRERIGVGDSEYIAIQVAIEFTIQAICRAARERGVVNLQTDIILGRIIDKVQAIVISEYLKLIQNPRGDDR
ncbi:MAG: hypothetical protein PHO48_02495 [Candidatus Gracilibacteria bacterium]|nr:hypothetical protein [Candidatus Gracilibacteria bacterium]MDD5179406.1 hypothetical protein [Candidatus Gracilibacteria bacterium]